MARRTLPDLTHKPFSMAEILMALSLATDLGAGRSMGHAMRACTLGMQMAHELRISETEQAELYYSFLLMHSGCTVLSLGLAPVLQGDELAAIGEAALRDDTRLLDTLDWMRRYVSPDAPLPSRAFNLLGMLLHSRDAGEHLRGACEVANRVDQLLGMPQGVQEAVHH